MSDLNGYNVFNKDIQENLLKNYKARAGEDNSHLYDDPVEQELMIEQAEGEEK